MLNIKNKSHADHRRGRRARGRRRGVIVAQGGAFGGWSLYAKDGTPAYCYNLFGLQRFTVAATPLPPGTHQVRMEFTYDGGGLGKGGAVDALRRRRAGGAGRVDATDADAVLGRRDHRRGRRQRARRSATTTAPPTAPSPDGPWVEIDLGEAAEDHDHLITPEERYRVAMTRQ